MNETETVVNREETDHGMEQLDERDVRRRLIEAQEELIDLGFTVAIVGVKARNQREYQLELAGDGVDEIPLRQIMQVAEKYRLDVFHDRDRGMTAYARF